MLRCTLAILSLFLPLLSTVHASPVQYSARKDIATGAKNLLGLAAADFNGDGKIDLAVTDSYSKTVSVYLGDGAGSFGAAIQTTLTLQSSVGIVSIVAGDVNEDGKQDLIVTADDPNQTDVVLLGKGDGSFTKSTAIPGSYGFLNVILIDVNGDGHLDLYARGNPTVSLFLGDGKGNFKSQTLDSGTLVAGTSSVAAIAAADFNRDNHVDLLTSIGNPLHYANSLNSLRFIAGVGNGTFQPPVETKTSDFLPASSIATADFNGDGRIDLLVGSLDIAAIALGDGDGSFQVGHTQISTLAIPPPASFGQQVVAPSVAAADLNGDGTAKLTHLPDNHDQHPRGTYGELCDRHHQGHRFGSDAHRGDHRAG